MKRNKADHYQNIFRLGISSLLLAAVASTLSRVKKPIKPGLVTTNDADFFLIMGVHGVGKFGQEVDLENQIDNIDAVFLETGAFPYLNKKKYFKFPKIRMEKMNFYHKLIPLLRSKHKPILFGDLPFSINKGVLFSAFDSLATTGAATLGTRLILNKKRNPIVSLLGAGLSFWGLSAMLRRFATINTEFIRRPDNQKIREYAFSNEVSNPQDVLVVFRNALITYKLLFYAQNFRREHGRKPVIALTMGSGHELISEYLKAGSDFCHQLLTRYPNFVKKFLLTGDLPDFYMSLAEVVYNDHQYQSCVYTIPELEADIAALNGH